MLKYHKTIQKPMRKQVLSGLQFLDFFGQPPGFRILKGARSTTSIGIICTFILLTTVFVYAIFALQQLFTRTQPSIFTSQNLLMDSSPFPLMINNYTFAVSVVDLNLVQLPINPSIFSIKAKQCYRERIQDQLTGQVIVNQNCTEYPLETCRKDHFVTETQINYFKRIKLGTLQCFQKDVWQANPPVLQSFSQGMIYQYIMVTLEPCKNTTSSQTCASPEKISQQLLSGYYVVHQSDFLLRHEDADQPFEEVITLQTTTFSITSSKQLFSQVQLQTVLTDKGIITKNYETETAIIQYLFRETQELFNGQYIMQHLLRFDNKAATHQRDYIKLQTILGSLGGLYSVLFIMLSNFLNPIEQAVMNIRMVNKLFRFELEGRQQASDFKVEVSSDGPPLLSKQLDITRRQEIKRYLKDREKPIPLTLKNILQITFGLNKTMRKQVAYATQKYLGKLDVAYLISKIYEIDKLKYILLNQDQQHLFDYIPKPTIPAALFQLEDSKIKELEQASYKCIFDEEKDEVIKIQSAFLSYVQIQNQPHKSALDEQILTYMDQDLIQVFNHLLRNKRYVESVFQNYPLKQSINLSSTNHQLWQKLNLELCQDYPKMDQEVMSPLSRHNPDNDRDNLEVPDELR